LDLKRGAIATAAMPGDFGKPRPVVVLRSDRFAAHRFVTVMPVTGTRQDAPQLRLDLEPTQDNGLQLLSQAMIDGVQSIAIRRIGQVIGQLAADDMMAIDRALAVYLGFTD
jgi:mRNA interferase MazF